MKLIRKHEDLCRGRSQLALSNACSFSSSVVKSAFIGLVVLALLSGCSNPDFNNAKKHIIAGNFEDASSALRLAIQSQKDNKTAKGLLLYTLKRQSLLESENNEDSAVEDQYLQDFLSTYVLLRLEKNLDLFSSNRRKELEVKVKEFKDKMRRQFTDDRVLLRDWQDYQESFLAASKAIYSLPTNPDNAADLRAKDVAAAVLAESGDAQAAKYIVERAAQDTDILALLLVAGPSVNDHLKTEIGKSSSFIKEEGTTALAFMNMKDLIVKFVKEKGKFRTPRQADLPSDQQTLLEDEALTFNSLDPLSQLLVLSAGREGQFDPSTVKVHFAGPTEIPIGILSGYNPEKRAFYTEAFAFHNGSFKTLALSSAANGVLTTDLPAAERVNWLEDKLELRVAVEKIQKVTRTRSESATREVTRTRQEQRYNSMANGGYGGYVWVDVPYTEYENYQKNVEYQEAEKGAVWRTYVFDPVSATLTPKQTLWVPNSSSFESELERLEKAKTTTSNRSLPSSTDGDKISRMITKMMTESVSAGDLAGLSKGELRLVRNGVFARKGYMFKDTGLRKFFLNQSWYAPTTSDMQTVTDSLSDTQRSNLDVVKGVEGN